MTTNTTDAKHQYNLWVETRLDAEPFSHWGGVLNPLAHEGIVRDFFTLAPSLPYHPLFLGTSYEGLLEYSPLLFGLPGPHHPFLRYLTNLPPTWGFLWGGTAPFEIAKRHWQSLLTVLMPSGILSHLRFYSPSVLETLTEACSQGELAWLFGPCCHIFLPRRHEDTPACPWLTAANPGKAQYSDTHAKIHSPQNKPWWQVTEKQLHAFAPTLHNVYMDNMIQHLWEFYPEHAEEVEIQYGTVRQFVEDAVTAAHDYGFEAPEQEYKFLLLSLHYDVHADPSKEARQILANARHQPEYALQQLEKTLRNPLHERYAFIR